MIPAWANSYVGVPFLRHGRDPQGWDCWGVLFWCYRKHFGVRLPSYTVRYDTTKDAAHLAQVISGELMPWRELKGREKPVLGDVVLMRRGRHPSHVGLVIEPPRMLHVTSRIATQFQDYDGLVWGPRVVGIYRHEELDHAA